MAKKATRTDLREGLPGHRGGKPRRGADVLERADDVPVARKPDAVTPEIGKDVPSGQATKG